MQVEPLASADIGQGSAIYGRGWAAGSPGLYRWSGSVWELVGSTSSQNITGIFAFQNSLYMIGNFTLVGGLIYTDGVARWDGQQWYLVPGLRGEDVGGWASVEFDDGTGPAVYLTSLTINPLPGQNFHPGVFKFDGTQFTPIGYTYPPPPLQGSWVMDLTVFDDGRGPALYIGGGFPQFGLGANVVNCNGIVRWDGQSFEPLGPGGSNTLFMGEVDAPFGRSLLVGQEFPGYYGGGFAWGSALWVTCPNCYVNCDDSTVEPRLNVADFTCFLRKYAALDPYANCDGSIGTPLALDIADFVCFVQKFAAGCP